MPRSPQNDRRPRTGRNSPEHDDTNSRDRERYRSRDIDRGSERERFYKRKSRSRSRSRSRSPNPRDQPPRRDGRTTSRRSRSPVQRRIKEEHKEPILASQAHQPESFKYGKQESPKKEEPAEEGPPKEMPNYNQSGALAAEANTFKGVVLKYSEPVEARKPSKRYRLYVFKGKDQIDLLQIHRQSAYLIGRDRLVADMPIDHPSCSKQHAVIQYRQVVNTNALGETTKVTRPYILDINSANGTFVNGVKIPSSCYYELKLQDSVKFGFSSREYMLMSEDMADGDTNE